MAEKLADVFQQAQAPSITWEGRVVHSMFELPPARHDATLRVTFESTTKDRPEGLRLKVRGGAAQIDGQDLDDVVLWSDSAPPVVDVPIRADERGAVLRVWNCWHDPAGAMQAWIGNAGMLVNQTSSGYRLECSDGFGEAEFGDLVISVDPLTGG